MDKEQLHREIIQNLVYPRKIPLTVLLSEISANEFILIASLLAYEKQNGTHITVNELAASMDVSLPAVSRSLRHLEERGLLKRVCNEECRRNTFVVISDIGRKLFEENRKKVEYLVDKLIDEVSIEEIETAILFSKKVSEIVDRECKTFLTEKTNTNQA